MKLLPMVWMAFPREHLSTTLWEQDLPSGELFSRSLMMDALRMLPLPRLHILLPDMLKFANMLVLSQLSSLKSWRMEPTISRNVRVFPRKFSMLWWMSVSVRESCLKVCCLNQTWSPREPKQKFKLHQRKLHTSLSEHSAERFHQLFRELHSCLVVSLRKWPAKTWVLSTSWPRSSTHGAWLTLSVAPFNLPSWPPGWERKKTSRLPKIDCSRDAKQLPLLLWASTRVDKDQPSPTMWPTTFIEEDLKAKLLPYFTTQLLIDQFKRMDILSLIFF